ncbi:MAG: hypothetical protein ACPGOV_10165 [Magnetovibrionaceae bacterium]
MSTTSTRFERATKSNGLLETLLDRWRGQCETYNEDFDDYSPEHMKHALEIAAENPPDQRYGIYVLNDGGEFFGLSHFNRAQVKRTTGWTLRIHWTLMAPRFDFEEQSLEDIAGVTADVLYAAIKVAETELPCDHIKFHLSGIPDRRYLYGVATGLKIGRIFGDVEYSGNWLTLSDLNTGP